MDESNEITIDQIIGNLSERGQIEFELAGLRLARDVLSNKVLELQKIVESQAEEILELKK